MGLPDLIEIVPLDKPVRAEISVPGSKSITNRALILAALADGETTLQGALWSEDTQVMVDCLQKLGFEVRVELDPDEFCNRTITVRGLGGNIPNAGTVEKPLDLFVGNAGTAARFLSAMVCLGHGVYRVSGVPRMHERPQTALFQALRVLGYQIKREPIELLLPRRPTKAQGNVIALPTPPGGLPVLIFGAGPKPGRCRVDFAQSSQFASALILCAKAGGWTVEVVGENAEESPYVAMTFKLIGVFPKAGGTFQVEPDASSGSYFWAADWLSPSPVERTLGLSEIEVRGWPDSRWQIDEAFREFWPLPSTVSRESDLGDSIMSAIVVAPFSERPTRFTALGRLRLQECERVVALRTELTRCGAEVLEHDDTLTVFPSEAKLHGAEIETYDDHRMAMCFAILGLKVPGIKIKNPACVKKTFPNFFQKLAAPPPSGLGATILEPKTGRKLGVEELFAE